jgi:hypothetical protein
MFNSKSTDSCSMLFKPTGGFTTSPANSVGLTSISSVPTISVVPTNIPASVPIVPPTSVPINVPTNISPPSLPTSVDKQTQTNQDLVYTRLLFASKLISEKSKAMCILTHLKQKLVETCLSKLDSDSKLINELDNLIRYPTTCIPTNYNMFGIHSFIKLSVDDLKLKYKNYDGIAVLHTRVLYELIDENISTSDQLYKFIFSISSDKALQYALKLAKLTNGTFLPFEPLPAENWIECFSVAIAIFALDKGAQHALFTATQLIVSDPKAKELTISLVCDMVGCSYGLFDKSILTTDMEDVIYLSKKLVS